VLVNRIDDRLDALQLASNRVPKILVNQRLAIYTLTDKPAAAMYSRTASGTKYRMERPV